MRELVRLANCGQRATVRPRGRVGGQHTLTWPPPPRDPPPAPHLSHDGDRALPAGLRHAVLHQVVHVLVVEQPDQVEGAEAGGAAQGQVPDHHRAAARAGKTDGDGVTRAAMVAGGGVSVGWGVAPTCRRTT